jgi:hypothetical protein
VIRLTKQKDKDSLGQEEMCNSKITQMEETKNRRKRTRSRDA